MMGASPTFDVSVASCCWRWGRGRLVVAPPGAYVGEELTGLCRAIGSMWRC